MSLSGTASPYSGSIAIANPTDTPIQLKADKSNPVGCTVVFTGSDAGEVPAHRDLAVAFSVSTGQGCEDPLNGTTTISFTAGAAGSSEKVSYTIAKPSAAGDAKVTGIEWPTDPVLVHREGDRFRGSFAVVNPTTSKVNIMTADTGSGGADRCRLDVLAGDDELGSVPVGAYERRSIDVRTEGTCTELHRRSMALTLLARLDDSSKIDAKSLDVTTGPRWFGILVVLLVAGLISVLIGAAGWRRGNDARESAAQTQADEAARAAAAAAGAPTPEPPAPVHPPVADVKRTWVLHPTGDTATSWATVVTALGTAFAALFASTDLLTRVLGEEPANQVTLAMIGSAIAVALVAAAGIVTNIRRTHREDPTILAFVVGACLTLTGALTQLALIGGALVQLDAPGDLSGTTFLGLIATTAGWLLLITYGTSSIANYIERYAKDPDAPPDRPKADQATVSGVGEAIAPVHFTDPQGLSNQASIDSWVAESKQLAKRLVGEEPPAEPAAVRQLADSLVLPDGDLAHRQAAAATVIAGLTEEQMATISAALQPSPTAAAEPRRRPKATTFLL
jgi:hypothetical protein